MVTHAFNCCIRKAEADRAVDQHGLQIEIQVSQIRGREGEKEREREKAGTEGEQGVELLKGTGFSL